MAERQYTPGLIDRLRGRDPNNPGAPKPPKKPTIDEARRAEFKKNRELKGSSSGDGDIYKNGAGTKQSAQRMGMSTGPAVPYDPASNLDSQTSVPLQSKAVGKSGYDARAPAPARARTTGRQQVSPNAMKGIDPASNLDGSSSPTKYVVPKPAPKPTPKPTPKPAARPAPKAKPMSTLDKLRADKGFMSTIEKDAAGLRKPAQKAPPKAAATKKSPAKSGDAYDNYKKLMESM